ncbi:outer membrane beta-barrel protein [candidate division GN15 bacterium]|nr:outer membrane beta-barrel protein [candidate division GN15 bacterium]
MTSELIRWRGVGRCFAWCVLLLAVAGGSAVAQPESLTFGVMAGPVLSDQSYTFVDPTLEFDPRSSVGISLGMFADWRRSRFVSARLEMLYIRKGSEVKVRNYGSDFTPGENTDTLQLNDNIDYLSVAPGLKVHWPRGDGGPYALVAGRLDIKLGGDSELNAVTTEELEPVVWGATLGAGYDLPIGDSRLLSFETTFHLDFTDAYDLPRAKVRNRAFVFLLGMTI